MREELNGKWNMKNGRPSSPLLVHISFLFCARPLIEPCFHTIFRRASERGVDVSASSRNLVPRKNYNYNRARIGYCCCYYLWNPAGRIATQGSGVGFDAASSSSPAAAANRNQFVRLIRGVTNKVTYRGVCRTSRAIYFRAARMRREQRKLVVHDVVSLPARPASLPFDNGNGIRSSVPPLHEEHRTLSSGLTRGWTGSRVTGIVCTFVSVDIDLGAERSCNTF